MTRNDGEAATMMATVLEGRLPEGEGEVAAEKWTLLNLGVEPAVNQRISLTDPDTGQEEEFLLTGILSDIYANKKYGLLTLSAACSSQPAEENLVYLKFSEGTGYEEKTTRLQEELGIAKDQIRECPAREDRGRLYLLDAELAGLILLICMVVLYGVYRISLLSRLPQYGVLRAIGMTRKELRGVMLRELYLIYLPAVPARICLGLLTARGFCWYRETRTVRCTCTMRRCVFPWKYRCCPFSCARLQRLSVSEESAWQPRRRPSGSR